MIDPRDWWNRKSAPPPATLEDVFASLREVWRDRENALLARISELECQIDDIEKASRAMPGNTFAPRDWSRMSLGRRVHDQALRLRRAEAACLHLKRGIIPACFFTRRTAEQSRFERRA